MLTAVGCQNVTFVPRKAGIKKSFSDILGVWLKVESVRSVLDDIYAQAWIMTTQSTRM